MGKLRFGSFFRAGETFIVLEDAFLIISPTILYYTISSLQDLYLICISGEDVATDILCE